MASRRADKWVHDVHPENLVSKAATRALRDRLFYLWSQLALAARQAAKNPEHVHQTRVASRRAIAALDTFEDLLPSKQGKKIRKAVRKIRKAAGSARDDDVLLMRLDHLMAAGSSPSLETWRAEILRQRKLHQMPIVEIYRHLRKKSFKLQLRKLLKKIRWRGEATEPTYLAAANNMLRVELKSLELILAGPLPPPELLHPMRIVIKRLRYQLELFAEAFPNDLIRKRIYPEVSNLQELLGQVNDHATAIERMQGWRDSAQLRNSDDLLQNLIQAEQTALSASEEAIAQWWEAGRAKQLLEEISNLSEAEAEA